MQTVKSIIEAICARKFRKTDGHRDPEFWGGKAIIDQFPNLEQDTYHCWGITFGLKKVELSKEEHIVESMKKCVKQYGGFAPDYVFVIHKQFDDYKNVLVFKLTEEQKRILEKQN